MIEGARRPRANPGFHSPMSSNRPTRRLGLLLCLGALCGLYASPAAAEVLQLRSGKTVKAREIEVNDKGVRATLDVTGGTARITYRFKRFEPVPLIDLLDRHLILGSDAAADAAASLKIAGVAFDIGLMAESASHFAQAAALDPSLAPARDEGIGRIRDLEAQAALEYLEGLLRSGDALGVLAEAGAIRESALGPALTEPEALRVDTLAKVAKAIVDKAAKAVAAASEGQDPASLEPTLIGLDPKTRAVLEIVNGAWAKAVAAREAAIDPDLSNHQARRHLEVAGLALLDARRALRTLDGPVAEAIAEAAEDVRALLVTTYLDVADLFREAFDIDAARRWLRAANVLDPENARAREIRQSIEDDLRRERDQAPPWYGPAEFYTVYPGGFLPYASGCCSPIRAAPFWGGARVTGGFRLGRVRSGHFHGGLRFHRR